MHHASHSCHHFFPCCSHVFRLLLPKTTLLRLCYSSQGRREIQLSEARRGKVRYRSSVYQGNGPARTMDGDGALREKNRNIRSKSEACKSRSSARSKRSPTLTERPRLHHQRDSKSERGKHRALADPAFHFHITRLRGLPQGPNAKTSTFTSPSLSRLLLAAFVQSCSKLPPYGSAAVSAFCPQLVRNRGSER